ncbi:PP2C family protein-serine/threonine phosphatase [Pseudorhodoferax sp.]|uniref:PP2C family protein-serine/threonine phosphatase n=1 Tax=Pseudorhodoferax sp. TaxID=1993553 RepID=UPI002DD671F6|nr:protein phosphatase 2C domain-containing protein [Pseudorhodoferax sp.]
MLGIEIAILSDKGGRSYNEDACGHWHSDRHLCCVLADGAGGHGGGDVASRLAVETLIGAFADTPTDDGQALAGLVWATNERLLEHRASDKRLRDMHTTVVCLVLDFVDATAHWSHVGDSRLYWFRDGRLHDRTLDHSLVQSLINAGVLAPEQAREHPRRSELQSALGTRPEDLQVGASGGHVEVQAGDAFLLCSDGLWEFVGDEAMEHALGLASSPSAWLEVLEQQVREATRNRASHDNFSAVAVWLVEPLDEAASGADEAAVDDADGDPGLPLLED